VFKPPKHPLVTALALIEEIIEIAGYASHYNVRNFFVHVGNLDRLS